MSILLGVNIDHIATLREARGTCYPDPVQAALVAEEAGADGITIHLREDRRHIQDRDVLLLKQVLQTRMNLEMAATEEMLKFAEQLQPEFVCLVPEKREELTTEGGLDVLANETQLHRACMRLVEKGIKVSLFIDADNQQIDTAKRCHATAIEIHTGQYADAANDTVREQEYKKIQQSVNYALQQNLIVNAGHGLHYHNVQKIAAITGLYELNIGHSVISRAVFTGLPVAVQEMKRLIREVSN